MAIDNKLKTAATIREENIKKMQERLKEHVSCDLFIYCGIVYERFVYLCMVRYIGVEEIEWFCILECFQWAVQIKYVCFYKL